MPTSPPAESIAKKRPYNIVTCGGEAKLADDEFAQVKRIAERFASEPPIVINFEKGTALGQRIIIACKMRLPDVDPRILTVREYIATGAFVSFWKCFICDHSFKKNSSHANRMTHTTTKKHLRKLAKFLGVTYKCFLDNSEPGYAKETIACPILGCVKARFHNTDELKAHYKDVHSSALSGVEVAGYDDEDGVLVNGMGRNGKREDLGCMTSTPITYTACINAEIAARPRIDYSENTDSLPTADHQESLDNLPRQADPHHVRNIQLQSQVRTPPASSVPASQIHPHASLMLPQGHFSSSYLPLTAMPLLYVASPPNAIFCRTGIPLNMDRMPNHDPVGLEPNGPRYAAYQPGIDGLHPGPSRPCARTNTLMSISRTESLMSVTTVRQTVVLRPGN